MSEPLATRSKRNIQPYVLPSGSRRGRNIISWPVDTEVVSGHAQVMARQELLRSLAEFSGQRGAADDLAFFLSLPDAAKKIPHLLLTRARLGEPGVNGFKEAVFLFEYRTPLGMPSNVFSTADSTGRRNVFAAPENRSRAAARAARYLMARGAHMVHVAYQPSAEFRFGRDQVASELHSSVFPGRASLWSLREFETPLFLPLAATFDATLARIGQRTRSNLRYYRRRTERDFGASFVPQIATHQMTLDQFIEFNRGCTFAVSDDEARRRFQALSVVAQPLFCGVRDRDGEWLSVAGGRRRPEEVEIDWQMNRKDLPQYSLCIVLRSFLIEREVAAGTLRLYIEGGTPHPIRRSFVEAPVSELTVRRRSLYATLLTSLAARLYQRTNYLAQLLRSRQLTWHPW